MNTVTICENSFDPSTWLTYQDVGDVRNFLIKKFDGKWPENAKIYLNHVANNADITPHDPAGVERLGKVTGNFFIVVYPEGLELILIIVAIAIAAVAVGLSFLLRPSANVKNPQQSSANNHLSDRQNTARPNERIPDIYGQLWATPDLIAVPYRVFIGNQEVEYCYMCLGRGDYWIDRIREDVTNCEEIDGYSVEVYKPNTSPNSGDPPMQSIGDPIKTRVVNLQVFGAVNGQILSPPNSIYRGTGTDIKFVYPNLIVNDGTGDFTALFTASTTTENQYITIGGLRANDDEASDPGFSLSSVHLHGTYKIIDVGTSFIALSNPSAVNSAWNALNAFLGHQSRFTPADGDGIDLISSGPTGPPNNNNWTQKFEMLYPQMTELWCNFVNPQGGYKVDANGNQFATVVTIQVRVQACNFNGAPLGVPTIHSVTLTGSSNDRNPKGCTIKIVLPVGFASQGGILVDARRSSLLDTTPGRQVNSQTQWRDAYVVSPVVAPAFGNITTIQTVVRPTLEALNIKSRKLNCLVMRRLVLAGGPPTRPQPPSGVTGRPPSHIVFPGGGPNNSLIATKNAADIICAMALDPFIGGRTLDEIDIPGIYAIAGPGGLIEKYFNVFYNPHAPTEFCYTFDDAKVSFEESIADIASSIFCVAYRRGSVLTLSFEKKTPNSTLLFNHRNKLPRSETRTVTFGSPSDQDGINLDYIEPQAANFPDLDTTVTLYFPPDQSARNPKKVTSIGIRNVYQATLLGWRLYQKLLNQNTTVQFEATQESALCVLQDRILVADNTRSDVQDGEVIAQDVLQLTLSQKTKFIGGRVYTIFLQHPDATVESIPITAGAQLNQVILGHAPTVPCVIDTDNWAKTTYMIIEGVV